MNLKLVIFPAKKIVYQSQDGIQPEIGSFSANIAIGDWIFAFREVMLGFSTISRRYRVGTRG